MNTLAYKFVKHDVPELDTLKDTRPYILASKIANSETLTREEKNEITKEVRYGGVWKLGGWLFPFHGLRTFYVKQYNHVVEVRAYDKTAIRATTYGRIQNITEQE